MKRLPMLKIREAPRLKAANLTQHEIAASVGVGRSTVGDYLDRAREGSFSWPLPDDPDDAELERRLFSSAGDGQDRARPQSD